MPDEILNQATPETADGGTDIDPSSIPDALPAEDVTALKNAFERQKAENRELREAAKKAKILDDLMSQGIDPKEIPAKLKQLKAQQEAEADEAKLRAEIEAQANAKLQDTTRAYEEQIGALNAYIRQQADQQVLDDIFLSGGGQAHNTLEMQQFRALIAPFVELEAQPIKQGETIVGYKSNVKAIRKPDLSEAYYVEDERQMGKVRPATIEDFVTAIKKGSYGRPLQTMLPAYNQSSGSGLPTAGGRNGGKPILSNSELGKQIASLTPEQLAQVARGGAELMDR